MIFQTTHELYGMPHIISRYEKECVLEYFQELIPLNRDIMQAYLDTLKGLRMIFHHNPTGTQGGSTSIHESSYSLFADLIHK